MMRSGRCTLRARTSAPASAVMAGKVAGRRPRLVWRSVRQTLVGSLLLPAGFLVVLAAWICTALMRLARAVRSGHSRPVAWEQGPALALLLVLMAWPCAASGAVAHLGRQLQATPNVFNSDQLAAAVNGDSLDHLVLAPGVYEMGTSDLCSSFSWLCVTRTNLIIEAAEPGSVVLDAKKQGRTVLDITASGAELIGLNITGGEGSVRARI